jgi:hypothetical protein
VRRKVLPLLSLLSVAFAPAPLPRRGPEINYQKMADAARWLSPKEAGAQTTLQMCGVRYRAEFRPHSSGCAVVASDLKTGAPLWRAPLKGLGPIDHSKYFNAVRVEPVGGEALAVYGQESAGRYVEIVSLKIGRTLGHKLFPE